MKVIGAMWEKASLQCHGVCGVLLGQFLVQCLDGVVELGELFRPL